MLDTLYAQLNESAPVAVVVISLSLMLMLAFLMTRLTKLLRLPNVTAYIVTGILIGPYFLDLIPRQKETSFLMDCDYFYSGNCNLESRADISEKLHNNSNRFLRSAITDTLHFAMEPEKI